MSGRPVYLSKKQKGSDWKGGRQSRKVHGSGPVVHGGQWEGGGENLGSPALPSLASLLSSYSYLSTGCGQQVCPFRPFDWVGMTPPSRPETTGFDALSEHVDGCMGLKPMPSIPESGAVHVPMPTFNVRFPPRFPHGHTAMPPRCSSTQEIGPHAVKEMSSTFYMGNSPKTVGLIYFTAWPSGRFATACASPSHHP